MTYDTRTHIFARHSVMPLAAFWAYCVVYDPCNRPLTTNCKLQNKAVDNGVVFG